MIGSIAGLAEPRISETDFSFAPGDEVELAEDVGTAWTDSGLCEAIEETTAKPTAKRKKGT